MIAAVFYDHTILTWIVLASIAVIMAALFAQKMQP